MGTTFSCVAVYKEGRVKVLSDKDGHKLVPSVVAFSCNENKITGHVEAKRLIGRKFDDPAVQANLDRWPFQVTAGKDGKAQASTSSRRSMNPVLPLSPTEFVASDIALIKVEGEKYDVIICKGDNNLGGEDFDTNLVKYCVEQIENIHGVDVSLDSFAMRRLRSQCQFVKCKLSEKPAEPNYRYRLELDDFVNSTDVNLTISRDVFEKMNQSLFDRAIALVPACLEEAQMTIDDIDDIVPVGGSMRIPKLREMLQDLFKGRQLYGYINPDEAIAVGASILAAQKMQIYLGHFVLSDITPFAIGVKANIDGEMIVLIPRNSKIPYQSSDDFFPMSDFQRAAAIKVYQGENKFVKDNVYLGETTITGLRPDLSLNVKIVVTVQIDENGILKVTATEVATGNEVEECLHSLVPHLNVL
ncbi:hypothetical protein B566_EDAN013973, partial [Ephemera danica]